MSTNVGEIDLSLILNSNKFSSQLKNIETGHPPFKAIL